jgi:hypothetical protein
MVMRKCVSIERTSLMFIYFSGATNFKILLLLSILASHSLRPLECGSILNSFFPPISFAYLGLRKQQITHIAAPFSDFEKAADSFPGFLRYFVQVTKTGVTSRL